LILRGDWSEIIVVVGTAILGIWLIASALEGYLAFFGRLGEGAVALISRLLMLGAGLAMALPGGGTLGLSHLQLTLLGIGLAFLSLLIVHFSKSKELA